MSFGVLAGLGMILSYQNKRDQEQAARTAWDAQVQALDEASELTDAAYDEALGYLDAGYDQAAMEIIAGAKIASRHILEYGGLSIDAQERFYEIADEKLAPFVRQGLVAQDEMASMLGIPNSNGELVPYDLNDLRETPGYQFQFEEGVRAVDASGAARGTQLSGRQMKELTTYGDKLAQLYFGTRLNQLGALFEGGLNAATNQAELAYRTGQGIGSTYEGMGSNLADIEMGKAEGMANLALGRGEALSGLTTGRAQDQTTIALGRANAATSRAQSDAAARSSLLNNVFTLGSMLAGQREAEDETTNVLDRSVQAPRVSPSAGNVTRRGNYVNRNWLGFN